MSQTGCSTPTSVSLSTSAILEDLQRNGLYIGHQADEALICSAKSELEEDFRLRLTRWLRSRSPSSSQESIQLKVDILVLKFDFSMRCRDDRESMLGDMLDLAKMMTGH